MHARNRTWLLGSDPVERCRQRTLPVEGGDGSTLSLDFTTGVLDPRLTFGRLSNATYVNSSGIVQFANANMFVNSEWTDANNNPTGWTVGASTGSISRSNETRTLTCAAQQYWWYQQPASRSGLTYSVSVEVTAVSGTLVYGDIILAGSSTYIAWYKDGVFQATSTATPVTTGVITLIFTANSDNTILRLGLGSAGTNVTGSVTLRYPQFQQGQVPLRSYYANSSTSAARYSSARFDHDPTTLAPRGLLIEGQAVNIALRSDDFNTTVVDGTNWSASGYTAGTLSTTLPDGTTGNARRISVASGSGSFRSAGITVTASTAYTWSFWARNNGGSQARFRVWNVTAGSSIVDYTQSANNYVSQIGGANNTSSTWVRVSVSFTTPVGCTSIYVYPCSSDSGTVDLLVWGAQVELGSGASSYIPTGASTASRAADSCIMEGTNFSDWWANPASWSMLLDFTPSGVVPSQTPDALRLINRASTSNSTWFYFYGASTMTLVSRIGNGTAVENNAATGQTYGNRAKVMHAIAPGVHTLSFNGSTVAAANTIASMPTGINALGIMNNGLSGALAAGHAAVRSVKFWPTALPQATLNSLTTL